MFNSSFEWYQVLVVLVMGFFMIKYTKELLLSLKDIGISAYLFLFIYLSGGAIGVKLFTSPSSSYDNFYEAYIDLFNILIHHPLDFITLSIIIMIMFAFMSAPFTALSLMAIVFYKRIKEMQK